MTSSSQENGGESQPVAWWEIVIVLTVVVTALVLGGKNLSGPSLWHDELVHVYAAKGIIEHGRSQMPGGAFYPSSMAYNYLLAGVIAAYGDGAAAVRSPSVLFSALNVILLYLLTRKLLGRPAALVAACLLAFSPWHVAWARQARLYELQASAYLLVLALVWMACEFKVRSKAIAAASGAVVLYFFGVLCSFHSILFLGGVGGYAILMVVWEKSLKSRWGVVILLCMLVGLLTIGGLQLNPNEADKSAVFETGLGGQTTDPQRPQRWLYVTFLKDNLSMGFLLLALAGTVLAPWHCGRRGLYMALGFWVPVLVLTFLIGYRRPRFMFFAYPCYVALSAYAITWGGVWLGRFRRSLLHGIAAVVLLAFFVRLGFSTVALARDSLEVSRGAHVSLARRHPQWEKPCIWIREHRRDGVVLTTTYLPVLYYLGHVDEWFPNRYRLWEKQESGLTGLGSLEELQEYVREHKKGWFIAEHDRFEKFRYHGDLVDTLGREVAWVKANMTRVDEACSDDVTVYTWGFIW
jgi:4-amino-4-deoxy-L-arabinose transferase-like glycosyltransferase